MAKVPGPVGFDKIKNKAAAKQAAAEWVNNTSSGNVKSDAAAYDALMKKAGFPNAKNPFTNLKPKAKPKPKATLSKSEKDFIAGQKFKAKIVKKTGVYPNTAR